MYILEAFSNLQRNVRKLGGFFNYVTRLIEGEIRV